MGQRDVTALPYKSAAHTWDDFIACEVSKDAHEVHPSTWPPPRTGTMAGDPSMALPCVHCGAWCITYAGHALPVGASGRLAGVTVKLPA